MVSHPKYGPGYSGTKKSHPEEEERGEYAPDARSNQLSLLPNSELYRDCTTVAEKFGALARMLREKK